MLTGARVLSGAAALVLLVSAGCSIRYDADDFQTAEEIDPSLLSVDSVEAPELLEGLGADESSRELPIFVTGSNIADDASIVIEGGEFRIEKPAIVSRDGTMAAVSIRLPVDDTLAQGQSQELTVTVSQGDDIEVTATERLSLEGLDELVIDGEALSASALQPNYSSITLLGDIAVEGEDVVRLLATGPVDIDARFALDGEEREFPGAGGHPGGLPEQDGAGDGGGIRGTNTAGGGGGGNSESGEAGQGSGAGEGGAASTATLVAPLEAAVGQGGGGGGGSALGAGAGGAGGGGLAIIAGGPVTLADGSGFSARGADGESRSNCTLNGGGGGGGSGGAIILASDGLLTFEGESSFDVGGGIGGSESALGNCKGGDGASGQIRLDGDIQGTPGGASFSSAAIFAPASVPSVATVLEFEATLLGEAGSTVHLRVDGGDSRAVVLSGASEDITVQLDPGLRELCLHVDSDAALAQPEALRCLYVAVVPR